MEIELTKQQTENYKTQIKNLSKHKPDQLSKHIPDNLTDILTYFHVTGIEFEELDKFYENMNKAADLKNSRDLLVPIVHVFLHILYSTPNYESEPRELTNAEVSAIHYFLLNPKTDLLRFEMFKETMYRKPNVKNTLLRMFFFWNGCLCLQYKSLERAEFMFYQCVTVPTDYSKPSKVGLEAGKKLMLLYVARGTKGEIAAPYQHLIPACYVNFAERCLKLQIGEMNRIIADEEMFRKDGNESLIEFVFKQVQFLILERIAKAYSVIDIIQLKNKSGLSEDEIAKTVKMASDEKGKDWVYIKEDRTVHFGMMNKLQPISNQAKVVKINSHLIVEACEYIDSEKEKRREGNEKRMKEEKETKEKK